MGDPTLEKVAAGTSKPSAAEATEATDVLAAMQTVDKTTGKTIDFDENGSRQSDADRQQGFDDQAAR